MFLLTIDPTFIPHKFGILDFGFMVFCQFNKNRQSAAIQQIRNPKSKITPKVGLKASL
jgi:hypothetical protein